MCGIDRKYFSTLSCSAGLFHPYVQEDMVRSQGHLCIHLNQSYSILLFITNALWDHKWFLLTSNQVQLQTAFCTQLDLGDHKWFLLQRNLTSVQIFPNISLCLQTLSSHIWLQPIRGELQSLQHNSDNPKCCFVTYVDRNLHILYSSLYFREENILMLNTSIS